MIFVLGVAGMIWWGGGLLHWNKSMRLVLIALLYATVVLIHLTLPATSSLRVATGGTATLWLILGGLGTLVFGYAWGISKLRQRATLPEKTADSATPATFSETELNRYARHIMLRELGGKGQKRLKAAKVLVIGAGGLGAPVLQYLTAAGVGTIGVIDDDVVENSNLQRQVIHHDADIGTPKVFSAQATLSAQNPFVKVLPFHRCFTDDIAAELLGDFDLILDGSDNFETRYLANATAVALGKPLISGALSQWEGQVSLFDPARGGPCYQCIFPSAPSAGLAPSCAEAGVIAPLPGVLGAMMAVEALKQITKSGDGLRGQMMIYDGLYGETRKIALKSRPDCPVCGHGLDKTE